VAGVNRSVLPGVALLGLLALTSIGRGAGEQRAAGEKIYREGIGARGQPIAALVQGDVRASSATLACANCHKRSGLGASEGRNRALPVTAAALFGADAAGSGAVPARTAPTYNDASLRHALSQGIAADGRELGALMPRYQLSQEDSAALLAYLHVLGAPGSSPGANDTEVELVTIVAESAPASEREAVTRVVTRFAQIKNSGTRREAERASASRRQLYGERHIRGYRHWNLAIWTLSGAPESWPAQLEQRYAATPPFAVISGAVGDHWNQVHEFCERHELPCVMPVSAVPGDTGHNHYNVYYSEGVLTQARVTARELLASMRGGHDRVLLLHQDDRRGGSARDAFISAWTAGGGANLRVHGLASGAPATVEDLHALLLKHQPDVLIAWLEPAQLRLVATAANQIEHAPRQVYTAEDFSAGQELALPVPFGERLQHVYPYRLPAPGRAQFPREQVWLRSQHLDSLALVPAAKALFACHATGEALSEMVGNFSRDYLIETLEHMLDGTNMTTLYPLTTLGTGQRYLAKGAYVARPGRGADAGLYTDSHWVQL
jgi:hypothetical protein